MSLSCVSFLCYYFQFYPFWPLVNPPRWPSRPSKLSGKPKSLLTLLLCYFGLQLVNLLYFYPPSHSNLCTGNHPTPKPTTFPGPSPTHLPRGLWERRCQKLPDVLDTHISSQSFNSFHLLKKVIELTSSSTPLLSVAADIIITLSSSSSPSNIINTTGCHVNHNSNPTRDSALPDSSFISLGKGDKAVSEGSDRLKVELPLLSLRLSCSSFNTCLFSPFVLRIFRHQLRFDPNFISDKCLHIIWWKTGMGYFLLTSDELSKIPPGTVFQSMARISWQQLSVRRHIWRLKDLNKIHVKNEKFSFRQLKIYYIFRSSK